MGLKDWLTSRRLNRLEGDLKMLQNKINFNPKYAIGLEDIETSEYFTQRLEEYRIWYMGSSRLLREMYRTHKMDGKLNYFWHKAPVNYRLVHSGIPGLISKKMATILFGRGHKVELEVFNDKGDVDESKTEQAQELVDNLRTIVDMDERLERAGQNESWGGHIFFKFSHKISLSNYPILEVADIRKASVVKERGITKAIIFKYWYTVRTIEYRLDEIYTTNESGDAIIENRLYKLKPDGKEERVELTEIAETSKIKPIFTYTGLKGMLAFDKPNMTPSHEFMDSDYGASDYEGSIDSFDALDEAYSELIRELRANKTLRFIPKTMVPHIDGVAMLPDEFIDNFVQTDGDEDQNTEEKINITPIPDKTEQHLIKWRTALTTAINNAGLSPFALGITGLESISSSAESQQERNKTTLETRDKKHKIWKPFLEDVYMKMLEMNSWLQTNTTANQEGFADIDLDFSNMNVKVSFNDYVITSQKEQIETWGGAKSTRVASTETAIKAIHPDWSETQIMDEVNRIRFEEGTGFDNPNNLPELTGITLNDNIEPNTDEDEDE